MWSVHTGTIEMPLLKLNLSDMQCVESNFCDILSIAMESICL
jgi:hypothetical protein